jgi:hypothetical protein
MAQRKAHRRAAPPQQIPRILPAEAVRILHDIEHLLDNSKALLADLSSVGIAELLRRLNDRMLQLAIQPDDSGERTRARLMSAIVPALLLKTAEQMSRVEDFVRFTNVMLPCLLLELGRRKRHIEVELPADPAAPDAQFRISFGGSHSHILSAQQVVELVTTVGEELVGVCYFGDELNRKRIEEALTSKQSRPKHLA